MVAPSTAHPAAVSPWQLSLQAMPMPALLQDFSFRLLDCNAAYADLLGHTAPGLRGRDPIDAEPPQDRDATLALRRALLAGDETAQEQQRYLNNGQGRERWFTTRTVNVAGAEAGAGAGAAPLWLTLWHDISSEVLAREQAHRAQDELAQWFDLSGTGMLVYDASGLIVRSNAAFEALVDPVPELLSLAAPELQELLGWQMRNSLHGMVPELTPGAAPIERQALVQCAPGVGRRRLSARLVCHSTDTVAPQTSHSSTWRVMAVVQDRSAEDDRDLAQLEMGMLMDTASVGVATFDPARGWLAPQPEASPQRPGKATPALSTGAVGVLQGISRELVEPESLPEFERLQRALRGGERTEVRYAVRHPEMGLRWLLTRVEPGALSGGRMTTSVVTLDVTDQERAQRRNEQLLHELTTILDSSTAGIAYMHGPRVMRWARHWKKLLIAAPAPCWGRPARLRPWTRWRKAGRLRSNCH
jgi:PAS domain S-box-containing protein